jgi:membrane protease YdiL (CAAX protease family)
MSTAVLSPSQTIDVKSLKPMAMAESVLLFGIPAILLALSLWRLWPTLMDAGMTRPGAYVLSLSLVNAGLLIAALVGYRLEGNPWTWSAFAARMRLTGMTATIWLWAIGSTLLFGVSALLINSLAMTIYNAIGFSMPDLTSGVMTIWMHVIVLFFNIVGEELWWRGYILPRQELTHGKITWLIHGTLWACFHMFKWWAVPFMLITCQIIPFVAQKTKNTWPGMINHIIINGAGAIMAAM